MKHPRCSQNLSVSRNGAWHALAHLTIAEIEYFDVVQFHLDRPENDQMNSEPEWLRLYKLAIMETDWSKMEERVRAAEMAIDQRLQTLSLDHGGTPSERQALVDALQRVSVLRGDAARWRASATDGK